MSAPSQKSELSRQRLTRPPDQFVNEATMANNSPELVEMRFFVTRDDYNVFDAVAKARRVPKNKLASEVFGEWAKETIHTASLVLRMTRGNGNDPQSGWGELGGELGD